MNKEELVNMFTEGLSIEELPTISNLEELRNIVESSDMDKTVKEELLRKLNHLIKDTLRHASTFTELIKEMKWEK